MPNRLAKETSPYLLQHRNNPVDWYPWGEEALTRARFEKKPILLSIGYSACHWCHVMERECFENAEIATLMNERFVCIKVDREERPDLDQIYQNVAQAITQSGGWPLTVFLTPELKPFFGGTYYPPVDSHGRPGFPRVLLALTEAFHKDSESVAENARRLTEFIAAAESAELGAKGGSAEPRASNGADRATLEGMCGELLQLVDWENGGMGGAPKFPNPMMLDFLWRFGRATNTEAAMAATLQTLTQMAAGGIYDHLGGGFHRYSVDATWSVPHFEKMLYDNGLLLRLYSQVLLSGHPLVTKGHRELFGRVLSQTVDYLLRELRAPEGVFFAAQDADSEGEEGKYFVWDRAALRALLTDDEASAFSLRYGVSEHGNFEHGKTVLHLAASEAEVAKTLVRSEEELRRLLEGASRKLLEARRKRVPPATDTKALASWNGLAISGLAWASQALRSAGAEEAGGRAWKAANEAFDFIRARFGREDDRLFSTFQGGEAKLNAYLDDYAFLSMAALDLARFESSSERVDAVEAQAERWIRRVLAHFRDPEGKAYFFTSDDHETLILRPRTIQDQAIPSGTGVVLQCLLALAEIDRDGRGGELAEEAQGQLRELFPQVVRRPYGCGELMNAAFLALAGPIVVSGPQAPEHCGHPHIFQKPAASEQGGRLLVCHQRTCGIPVEEISRRTAI